MLDNGYFPHPPTQGLWPLCQNIPSQIFTGNMKIICVELLQFFSDWTKPQQRSVLELIESHVWLPRVHCPLIFGSFVRKYLLVPGVGGYSQYLVTARIFEHIEPILGACSSESQVGWRLQVITSHHHIASSCNTICVIQSLIIIISYHHYILSPLLQFMIWSKYLQLIAHHHIWS